MTIQSDTTQPTTELPSAPVPVKKSAYQLELEKELASFSNIEDILEDPVARCIFYLAVGGHAQRRKCTTILWNEYLEWRKENNSVPSQPEFNIDDEQSILNNIELIRRYNMLQLKAKLEFDEASGLVPEDANYNPIWRLPPDAVALEEARKDRQRQQEERMENQRHAREERNRVGAQMMFVS